MGLLHQGLPNGGYNTVCSNGGIAGGVGGGSANVIYTGNGMGQIGMGTSPQAADSYFAEHFMEAQAQARVNVQIDTVENGFVMTINGKKFICSEPKELGDMLIAHMVAQRVSK